jgi:pilus assembly protein Flp/PilA
MRSNARGLSMMARGSGSINRPDIRFVKDENAATAIEYGLIASGVALALIPVMTGLGTHLKATFATISSALK